MVVSILVDIHNLIM